MPVSLHARRVMPGVRRLLLKYMWQGSYQKWNPVPHLENKALYVEAVHDDWEGFRIWFGSENRNAGVFTIVKFEAALMYVNSDESYRLSLVKNDEQMNFPHLFWQVEDSELLKEFHRQSVEIYKDWEIKHYAFLSASDCIDVLSAVEPMFNNLVEEGDELLELKLS